MEIDYKKYIKFSSIVCFVIGFFKMYVPLYGILSMLLGLLLYSYSEKDIAELYKKRRQILLLIIIGFLFNILAGLFLLLAMENVKNHSKVLYKDYNPPDVSVASIVNSEAKKIDILLKLGVGMVFISGILFATTSWSLLTNLIKLIILLVLGFLFLGLSVFAEKKLKIQKTSYMYWFLSMSFFFTIMVGIGYFGLLGVDLTYVGTYHDIMYSITYLYFTILVFLSYYKYKKTSLLYVAYTGLFFSISYLLHSTNLHMIYSLWVLSSITVLVNIATPKEHALYKFNNLISYLYILAIFQAVAGVDRVLLLFTCLLNIFNLIWIAKKNNTIFDKIISIIAVYSLILISVDKVVLTMLLYTLFSILIRFKVLYDDEVTNKINQIIFFIMTILLFIPEIFLSNFNILMISSLYLGYNLISIIFSNKNDKRLLDSYFQPVALFLLTVSIGRILNTSFFEISYSLLFLLLSTIYVILYTLVEEKHKKIYLIATMVILFIITSINYVTLEVFFQFITFIPLLCLYYVHSKYEEKTIYSYILYIYILLNVYVSIIYFELIPVSIFNPILVLLIYLSLLVYNRKNKWLTFFNSFAILLPLTYLVSKIHSPEYMLVSRNILYFYALYLLLKYINMKKKNRDIVCISGVLLTVIQLLFIPNLIIGLYNGLVGIGLIVLGYYKKDYNYLFIIGVIVTVLNIIIQLIKLWALLPFWLYLLLAGLGIIGFVTYKELNHKK